MQEVPVRRGIGDRAAPTCPPGSFDSVPAGVVPVVRPTIPLSPATLDAASLRREFPILNERVFGRPLVWLDNAATTQKPHQVISALGCAYAKECADLLRGARGGHALSQLATERFEAVRDKVRRFIAAPSTREVIFTSGTTESINLLAHTLGSSRLGAGSAAAAGVAPAVAATLIAAPPS